MNFGGVAGFRGRLSSIKAEVSALLTPLPVGRYIGWLGHQNLGDEALRLAIGEAFSGRLFLYDKNWVGRGLATRRKDRDPFDAVVLGGGTLINLYESRVYLSQLQQTPAAVRIIFGTGTADNAFWVDHAKVHDPALIREWVDFINEAVDLVAVRGPLSRELLVDAGVRHDVRVIGDPALFLCPGELRPRRRTGTLGVNLGMSRNLMWGMSDEAFLGRMSRALVPVAKHGWKLLFMPVWPDDVPANLYVVEAVKRQGGAAEVRMARDPREYIRAMDDVDIFIGEKLHSVILAACASTPAVMLEYRPKCLDFMRSMGLERFNVRADRVDPDQLAELVATCDREYDGLRHEIFDRCRRYRAAIDVAAAEAATLAAAKAGKRIHERRDG